MQDFPRNWWRADNVPWGDTRQSGEASWLLRAVCRFPLGGEAEAALRIWSRMRSLCSALHRA